MSQHIPHEVHPAALPRRAGQHLLDRCLEPLVGIAAHQLHTLEASPHQAAQKVQPKGIFLTLAKRELQDLPFPGLLHSDRHDQRLTDDPVIMTHLHVEGVQPQVGIAAFQRPVAEALDQFVEHTADAADLT